MNRSLIAAILAVIVLGGGAVGFYLYRDTAASQARVEKLAAEVTVELAVEKVDRSSVTALLKRVRRAMDETEGEPAIEYIRARSRLEFALDRFTDAWETIADTALAPGAEAEDLLLGSLAQMRLFETKGKAGGPEALGLSVAHYQATKLPSSLFRAWQLAYRSAAIDSWLEFQADLVGKFAEEPEGEFAQSAAYDIGLLMARGLGVADDEIEKVAGESGDDAVQRLCASIVKHQVSGKALRAGGLIQQARAWDEIPPEMNLLIATKMVSEGKPTEEDFHNALDRVRRVLERDPTNVDARHAVAILHLKVGDKAECASHIKWLEAKASSVDSRRLMWGRLLELAR